MDVASGSVKQDMPPPGGYKKIPYMRMPAKTYFTGIQLIGGVLATSTISLYLYYLNYKMVKREDIEMRSARNVILPVMIAERDREYLKQLRRNREEEAKLMANVPGWEVGTWYGEPVFKTLPKDNLVDPTFHEFYIHSAYKDFAKRAHVKLWS